MTFKDYFVTIKTIGHFKRSVEEIGTEICEAMGMENISSDTVKKWIYPKAGNARFPTVRKYFPKNKNIKKTDIVDTEGFIKYFQDYFKSKPNHERPSLEQWEQAFCELGNKGVIDTEHGEQRFYWSLLYQLCLMFELPKPKEPISMRHTLSKSNKPVLFGREDKSREIEEKFRKSNYIILTGIGGYGKSYLALDYAYKLRETDGYDVQRIICDGFHSLPLREVISRLEFEDRKDSTDMKERFNFIIDAVRTIKQRVLIILDNFDRKLTRDDWEILENLPDIDNFKILITSRLKLVSDKDKLVEIDSLDDNAQLELYSYHRFSSSDNPDSNKAYIDERKEILKDMFERVGNHTLMITLLAQLPKKTGLDEDRINKYLHHSLNIFDRKVQTRKDDESVEDTVKNIISQLFFKFRHNDNEDDIIESELSNAEKDIMRYMSLISPSGINRSLFEELIDYNKKDEEYNGDEIDNLLEIGLIMMDNEEELKIRLHPLIFETVYEMEENKQFYVTYMEYAESNEDIEDSEALFCRQWENFDNNLVMLLEKFKIKGKNSVKENSDNWRDLMKTKSHIIFKIIGDTMMKSPDFLELDPAEKLGYYQFQQIIKDMFEYGYGLETKNISKISQQIFQQYPELLEECDDEVYDDDFESIFKEMFPEHYKENSDFSKLFVALPYELKYELQKKILEKEILKIESIVTENDIYFEDILEFFATLSEQNNDEDM